MNKKTLESILNDLAISVGSYLNHIAIGGGYAPLIYKNYLFEGKQAPDPAATLDVDFLIPRKIVSSNDEGNLSQRLLSNGYEVFYKSTSKPPVISYLKNIANLDIEVEFLTSDKARDKKSVVEVYGVNAQTLGFLEMSLEKIVAFKLLNGKKINVVRPEAWVFHKLITFPLRPKKSDKAYKDLYGSWYVASELSVVSQKCLKDLKLLMSQHASWAKKAKKNIEEFLNKASPEDWAKLEAQDPNGRLTRIKFESFSEKINHES